MLPSMSQLLAIGDIHLGRLPAALPEELKSRAAELGPEAAWRRAVTEAIKRRVEAVLLAGDVVERSRDFFVAYGELKAGIEKLAAAGIPVLAVAGNHDTHVLPRLASEIDALHLLGAGGQWQRHALAEVDVIGWSFPQRQVRNSPLDSFPSLRPERPLIGLLHCDRDQSDSPYAPVSSQQLDSAPVAAWLLGHVHQPDELGGERPSGYLGSVTALRASETGARGPWLISLQEGRIRAEQLALAPLRFERLAVDVGPLENLDDLSGLILAATRERVDALARRDQLPQALGLRVSLVGNSRLARQLPAAAEALLHEARSWVEGDLPCFLNRIDVRCLPALDLDGLARQSDPAGLLARRLRLLAGPDCEQRRALIDAARPRLEAIGAAREFAQLERRLSDQEILTHLQTAGELALVRLLAQKGG